MDYSIRRLGRDDVKSYRRIRLEALKAHPDAFTASYEASAARPDSDFVSMIEKSVVFAAEAEGGDLKGIAAFFRNEGKERHRGWLVQMYVRPEMRGTGCALKLVNAVLDHARGEVLQVHLGVATHNEAAIRLYKKAGFAIYGTEPRALLLDGRYIDEHMMVRFLDEGTGKKTDQ